MSEPRFRLLRVLEYEGPLAQIQYMINSRSIKGTYTVPNGVTIREAIIGETMEILKMETPKFINDSKETDK